MKKMLFNEKIYSRWLVLFIDSLIVTWTFCMSFLLVHKFQYQNISTKEFLVMLVACNIITACVFVGMKIHCGVIRYSNTEDISRVVTAVALGNFTFWLFFRILSFLSAGDNMRWFDEVVLVNFFMEALLLIVLRVSVKVLFGYMKQADMVNAEPILIYGSDKNAILIKQAFDFAAESNFKIVGFIDNNKDRWYKNIEQKKVYPASDMNFLKEKHGVKKMVIMDGCLQKEKRANLVDRCIELGIKMVSVPPSVQWINGRLNLKQIRELRIEDLLQRDPIVLDNENIMNEVKGKCVLVTGAAGSIGSEIVRQLIKYQPKKLVLCDQAETPLHHLQISIEDDFPDTPVCVFMCNIQNEGRLKKLFNDHHPQIIFHAAAFKHVPMMESNPCEAILTNVLGTKQLADVSIEYKVEKFVMISTDKAVRPTNIMGASKRLAEMYIQSLNFNQLRDLPLDDMLQMPLMSQIKTKFITTRFGNVLGSNGSVVPRFREQIEKGGPVTVTHPEITRYFMTIPEAVQLVLEAGAMGRGGEIFIFDMGEPVKIIDLAVNMINLAGFSRNEIDIIFTGLRPGEKLYEELLNEKEQVIPTYNEKIKISKVINYHHGNLEKSIEQLLQLTTLADDFSVVKKMKEIIPEYKSNNSIYNQLDKVAVNYQLSD
ncbi:nucleoside-diphosphate sugar epimerase/dehydratase [Pseudopedobacter sp.]|uniref:polysaccharide biosynthesis protein n=1 Tax=Pseudopedobacter sp. TaxID=1936787 RepID=UPI00333EF9BA